MGVGIVSVAVTAQTTKTIIQYFTPVPVVILPRDPVEGTKMFFNNTWVQNPDDYADIGVTQIDRFDN